MTTAQTVEVNALALRPGGSGVQTYIRELLRELPTACGAPIAAHVQADVAAELPDGVRPVVHRVAAGSRRALNGLWLDSAPGTLHHGLDVDVPARKRGATVTTVHDLSVFDTPDAFVRHRVVGERLLLRHALRRADEVIAVSAFTADRIAAWSGRHATVVPLAPRSGLAPAPEAERSRVRASYRLPPVFVVQIATIEPRKDVATLAAACREVGVPLVLAGAVASGSRVPTGVQHLGRVADRDLAGLIGAATVVAYCSRYEGFGLPVVEAMACGAAVVATAVGAVPEVGGDAVVVVAPGRSDQLAVVIRDLMADPDARVELATRARRRASEMTWTATAHATAAIYQRLGVVW